MKEEVIKPEIIDADNQSLATKQASDMSIPMEEGKKEAALAEMGDGLAMEWVDIRYLIERYKEAVETAVMEWYSWAVYEDQKTRIAALNKLVDLWKVANKINTRDPIVVEFKPIFDKPPTLH